MVEVLASAWFGSLGKLLFSRGGDDSAPMRATGECIPYDESVVQLRESMQGNIADLVSLASDLEESVDTSRHDAKERMRVCDKKAAYRCLDEVQAYRCQLEKVQERQFVLEEALSQLDAAADAIRVATVNAEAALKREDIKRTMDERIFQFKLDNAGKVMPVKRRRQRQYREKKWRITPRTPRKAQSESAEPERTSMYPALEEFVAEPRWTDPIH